MWDTVIRHFLRAWLLKYAPKQGEWLRFHYLIPNWKSPFEIGPYGQEPTALDEVILFVFRREVAFWRWLTAPDVPIAWPSYK